MMKKVSYIFAALLALLSMLSCEKNPAERRERDAFIRWQIHSGSMSAAPATKALVEDDEQLQHLCTPLEEGGEGQSIGFRSDYLTYSSGSISRSSDVFNSARLQYFTKDALLGKCWNYSTLDIPWAIGGKYLVRAYYPESISDCIVKASSDANLLVVEYNTHQIQQDLLVAFNEVNTKDPVKNRPTVALTEGPGQSIVVSEQTGSDPLWYGLSQDFELNDPIPLFFRHAMAAVRVRFAFAYDDCDTLVSCRFQNKSRENGFHTVGMLLYGDKSGSNSLADHMGLEWVAYQSAFDEIPVYSWEVADGKGSEFYRSTAADGTITEKMAIGYSEKDRHVFRNTEDGVSTEGEEQEGTEFLPVVKQTLPRYNENGGWLLVIPQMQQSEVQLEFTTRKHGTMMVDLPQYTATDVNGNRHQPLSQAEALAEMQNPQTYKYLVAGHRYTYTVTLRRTDARVELSLEPWNEMYVTEEVVF